MASRPRPASAARGDPVTATVEQIAEVLRPAMEAVETEAREAGRVYADLDDLISAAAEAVAALGVGDGEVEYGVQYPNMVHIVPRVRGQVVPHESREEAEHALISARGTVLVQHTVGPWVEVTDDNTTDKEN